MALLYAPIRYEEDLINLKTLDRRAWWNPVDAVVTANVALSGSTPWQAIWSDGVIPEDGSFVLLTAQTNPLENKIYRCTIYGENEGWDLELNTTYYPETDDKTYFVGKIGFINRGNVHGGHTFVVKTITDNGDDTFTYEFVVGNKPAENAQSAEIYAYPLVTDGTSTVFTIPHGVAGKTYFHVQIVEVSTGEVIIAGIKTDATNITITMDPVRAAAEQFVVSAIPVATPTFP